MNRRLGVPAALAGLALLLCPAMAGEPPCLAVSIPPQAWVAEQLAGSMPLRVVVVVPPGSSPATYDPGARQLARLASCSALVSAGVPFETALLPRLEKSFPSLRLVDGLEGIELLDFAGHEHDHHSHGEGHHSCGVGKDPHFWLDPERMVLHARVIARELAALSPEHAADIEAREQQLARTLRSLDTELRTLLEPLVGRRVAVYHPSFGYFLGRYGMSQEAIETAGRDPGPRRLAEILTTLRESRVRAVIVQPEFAKTSAKRVAEALGAPTLTFDPLSSNYAENLLSMASRLADAHQEPR